MKEPLLAQASNPANFLNKKTIAALSGRDAAEELVYPAIAMTTDRPKIRVHRLEGAEDIPLPSYATEHSSGMDICAAVDAEVVVSPGERYLIPTGLRFEIPRGFEGQVRPRSGLALKHGISLPNTPGTIDADYRGELKVIIINHGKEPFVIKRGDRIAQLVIAPVIQVDLEEAVDLTESARHAGGFGHTGV